MKKYLSCIILILLCVICATIFFVNAKDVDENDEETKESLITEDEEKADKGASIDKSGTIYSEYLSNCNLRIEWAMYKENKKPTLYLSAELYLDSPEQITPAGKGYISINGARKDFTTSTMVGTTNLLCAFSTSFDAQNNAEIELNGYFETESTTASGSKLTSLSAYGKVIARENDKSIKKANKIALSHISQFPELASGDEITSLCMVLRHLKYNVDKCELSDLYLDKGPADYTNIFEANAGNPEDNYNSHGCMPPVIVKAANKYIGINGGKARAIDASGYNAEMLYNEVSQGNPVIVWVCEDFNITPSVFRTLVIDGKTIHLKSNVKTMVLIGYDLEKKTVTLANPSGNVFDVNMDLFEQRYSQVGSYAVLIK